MKEPGWNLVFFATTFRCYRQFTVQANTTLTVQCEQFEVKGGGKNCWEDSVDLFWSVDETYTKFCGEGGDLKQVKKELCKLIMICTFWFI